MPQDGDRFRAAAVACVHAAYKCMDDADAAAALLMTAQQWIELAEEHSGPQGHMSTAEVGEMATRAGVKTVILTHRPSSPMTITAHGSRT
jgi:hypothetical protein